MEMDGSEMESDSDQEVFFNFFDTKTCLKRVFNFFVDVDFVFE